MAGNFSQDKNNGHYDIPAWLIFFRRETDSYNLVSLRLPIAYHVIDKKKIRVRPVKQTIVHAARTMGIVTSYHV